MMFLLVLEFIKCLWWLIGLLSNYHNSYAFFIGGAAVSWSSKWQPTVATSSSNAEYIAANFAGHEAMWLRQLLTKLGYHIPRLTIYCNSQPAIAMSKNPEHHSRMKHINVMYHWLREKVEKGLLKLQFVPTDDICSQKVLPEWSMRSVGLDLGSAEVKRHFIEGVC